MLRSPSLVFPSLGVKLSYCFEGPHVVNPFYRRDRLLKIVALFEDSLQSALGIRCLEGFPAWNTILRPPSEVHCSHQCSHCLSRSRSVAIYILKAKPIPLFNILFCCFGVCTFFSQATLVADQLCRAVPTYSSSASF